LNFIALSPILIINVSHLRRGVRRMDWKKLLGSITESVDEELRLRNAYLVAENRILRQQIPGRVQLTDSDRKALAEIGQQLGKKALAEIATVAKPNTILAWHRTCADRQCDRSQPPKSVGRPRIEKELEDLVMRMARENRSWGYDRIVGALANLGYRLSDQTVGNVLKRRGIPPAPTRQKTTTWNEFIRAHMDMLVATDFFTTEVWSWFRLILSVMSRVSHGAQRTMPAAHLMVFLMVRWLLPISAWVSAGPARLAHMIYAAMVPGWSELIQGNEDVRRPLLAALLPAAHRGARSKGLAKVVYLSAGHLHPIRDGPRRGRPPLGRYVEYDNREAA
jgi:transposase